MNQSVEIFSYSIIIYEYIFRIENVVVSIASDTNDIINLHIVLRYGTHLFFIVRRQSIGNNITLLMLGAVNAQSEL